MHVPEAEDDIACCSESRISASREIEKAVVPVGGEPGNRNGTDVIAGPLCAPDIGVRTRAAPSEQSCADGTTNPGL